MCGICGIYHYRDRQPVDKKILIKMADTIRHRGPDGEGYFINARTSTSPYPSPQSEEGTGYIGLGHRRLAIIDLTTGTQPMTNENNNIWIVFNGEIYNFLQLRNQLISQGHQFKTQSDTEVIIHAYEEYGIECVSQLRGMFAFAIWDEIKQSLVIARDRVGKKPIYYTDYDGTFIFASELKSILCYPGINRKINPSAIHQYLTYQYVPGPETIFNGLYRQPPATVITVNFRGMTTPQRYWNLSFKEKTNLKFTQASEQLHELLTEATRIRLISDVPLGAFLSGGHDSSIIVGLMAKLADEPVKTFSIGFQEREFSELPYAKVVAEHFRTDHHEFIVKPDTIDILPKLVWHYDQPYADSSALPSYYVAQITRKYVTVALNGDGGDENFAGYLRYPALKVSQYIHPVVRLLNKTRYQNIISFFPEIESISARHRFRYVSRFLNALSEPAARRNVIWHCYFRNEDKNRIYSPDMYSKFQLQDAYDYLATIFNTSPANNLIDRTSYSDIMAYLPEDLLIKMDVASMANSLETRSPLLDHKVLEFTATLPPEWKLHHLLNTKYIFKWTYKNFLPLKILTRKKQGFGIPIGKWFRTELYDYLNDIILSSRAVQRGYFNRTGLVNLVKEHRDGKRDHGYRLWALLMLELWHQVFIDKNM